jgi:hypothetical protein
MEKNHERRQALRLEREIEIHDLAPVRAIRDGEAA